MKYLFTILLLIISHTSFSQTTKAAFQLDTVKDYRIKIDGGCGIYNFQTQETDSANKQNCFVIDRFQRGFFAIKGQFDHIYVKRIKIECRQDGFCREIFSGDGFTCTLITSQSSPTNTSLRQGVLAISNSTKTVKVEVVGKVDYKLLEY